MGIDFRRKASAKNIPKRSNAHSGLPFANKREQELFKRLAESPTAEEKDVKLLRDILDRI